MTHESFSTSERASGLDDLDPDSGFFAQSESSYHDERSFNDIISNNSALSNKFSLIFLNIRSAVKNLESFLTYLSTLSIDFSVIGLAETWLTQATEHLCIAPNYSYHGIIREGRTGGGVGFLIHNTTQFIPRDDLSLINDNIECSFIETFSHDKHFPERTLIGVVYRPPGTSVELFHVILTNMLNKIKVENRRCYLMGDFNINLLNYESHTQTNDFLDLMYSFSLYPLIDKPTRVTSHSSTLIDNIFSNSFQDQLSGILYTDVSDHLPIYTIDNEHELSVEPVNVLHRRINDQLIEQFNAALGEHNWAELYRIERAEDSYNHISRVIQTKYEEIFPLIESKRKRKPDKPWITPAIKKSIYIKNKLYKLSHRKPTNYYIDIKYRAYSACLKRVISLTKKQYYNSALMKHKGDLKNTWKVLKEVIGVPNKSSISKTFTVDNELVSQPESIAKHFNDYFVNVGGKLATDIPDTQLSPLRHVKQNAHSVFLAPIVEQEIIDCLSRMKEGANGHDSLKPSVIKKCKVHLAAPLTYVFNLSITEGHVPTNLKYAYITPVFKSGDPTLLNNYRPISVLPVFSKVLERLIFNRIYSFIDQNDILSNHQFGFRKKLSTEMALLTATDKLTQAIDNKEHTIGLFLDLKKAFDTVNIDILLQKLFLYGIRGNALLWFRSYLSTRTQSVKYYNIISSSKPVTIGVPQGSILGPLLFILYINDMPNLLQSAFPIIFADDTTLFISGKNIEVVLETFKNELVNLVEWFRANKLSLNLNKTQYMLFTTSPGVRLKEINFEVNGNVIARVKKTKFLGVYIDEKLSWLDHIDHICLKIRKSLGVIRKASRILDTDTLINLYYTMLYPYISYCHLVWGKAAAVHLKRISNLQKRAIRIITCQPWLAHTQPLFTEHNVLKFDDLYVYLLSLFIYKFVFKMLPVSFRSLITINVTSICPNQPTRLSIVHLPLCRTNYRKNSLHFQCPKLCNDLIYPLNIPPTLSFPLFKKLIKNILV